MDVLIGVDIGQKRDPTALAVAEAEEREEEWHFLVRHLERLPLGTSYPQVARRLEAVVAGVQTQTGELPKLYVDATGVGQPIVDLLSVADVRPIACYFTHGDRRTEKGWWEITIGKAYLVSRLQVLLQTGKIHLPRTSEASALAEELLDYEIRVDQNANDRYGAFRVGTHDDLVTALGLAVQADPRSFSLVW